MNEEYFTIPYLRLDSEKIIVSYVNECGVGRRKHNGKNLEEDRKKAYQGEITQTSRRMIYKRINEWCEVVKAGNANLEHKKIKLVLLTVTLASAQDWGGAMPDKKVKAKLLEPLMKWLQYNFKIEHYFWRAESQRNGNIHFHILTDRYLPKEKVEKYWNKKLNEYGLMDDYKKKYGNDAPPSCNIRVFDMDDESIAYLSKYVSKSNDRRKIDGLQYRFSNSIRCLKPLSIPVADSSSVALIDDIEKRAIRCFGSEYFQVYYLKSEDIEYLKSHKCFAVVNRYRCTLYDLMYRFQLNEDVSRLVFSFHYTYRKVAFSTIDDVMQHLSIGLPTAMYLLRKGFISLGAAMQPLEPSSPIAGFQPAIAATQQTLTF